MKISEIEIGGYYVARVAEKLTVVKVLSKNGSYFEVLNTATGRKTTFKSARRFQKKTVEPKKIEERIAAHKTSEKKSGQYHSPVPVTHAEEEKAIAEARVIAESALPKSMFSHSLETAMRKSKEHDSAPHLIIIARAGTGKTTTGICGLQAMKGIRPLVTPSPQQKLIWDSFALSKDVTSICMVAFNKSIADELQRRVPPGVQAMTLHSLGFKAVNNAFGRQQPNRYVIADTISEIEGRDLAEIKKYDFENIKATEKLVGLCKQNLIGFDGKTFEVCRVSDEELSRLANHYEVELNGSALKVFDWVRGCLTRALTPNGKITFDDMVWLPVVRNLALYVYEFLFVDEAQDLNRCQQALALRAGKRLVFCGDDRQAIYGFAGADSESLKRLEEILGNTDRGVVVLPLTVTRRCGKAIVEEAKKIVVDFEAHESNGDGSILRMKLTGTMKASDHPADQVENGMPLMVVDETSYRGKAADNDMVLCRVNAPLVSECFKFLKEGRKAIIVGRDVGAGLISTIKQLKPVDIADLSFKLSEWLHRETQKENAKRNPDETRLIGLQDRYDCLCCFMEDKKTVDEVIRKIEVTFTDDKDVKGIRLSSIHRSKGLEADRVFLLEPAGKGVPHPMARSEWQISQEWNLRYVAITRAIKELVYVS